MLLDPNIYNSEALAYVLSYTAERGIPVMGFSANLVKAGALVACSYDAVDLGAQTGELILDVLSGGPAGEVPAAPPRKIDYVLNTSVAGRLGLKIPQDVIDGASETVK